MGEFRICIIVLACLVAGSNAQKSVIAHMVNTIGTVKWAVDKGANGVELDLHFSREGVPTEFRHGGACDCTCICPFGCRNEGVCSALLKDSGKSCEASTHAHIMAEYLGTPDIRDKLAIIYIDSKLVNSMKNYFGAGQSVVQLLDHYVFNNGYKGQVVISGLKAAYIDFLKGALDAARKSKYVDSYFFTMDGEGKDYNKVWDTLMALGTKNIVYSTGISACVNGNFKDAIRGSIAKDGYAGFGIWTLDKKTSMEEYIGYGATSIVTNFPGTAVDLIGKGNLAKPGEALRATTRSLPFKDLDYCDCGYRNDTFLKLGGGGCIITTTPPKGKACKCEVNKPWTCRGDVVSCKDANSEKCKNPTPDKATCQQGGGDCDGYKKK